MGKTKKQGATMDPKQVTEWFHKLMEGAKKGLNEFTEVAKETTFEVRIMSDGKGIGFEADLNIVPDYEHDEEPLDIEELQEVDADKVEEEFKERVKKALTEANGNLQKAADMLGISKHHLKSQLAHWNL